MDEARMWKRRVAAWRASGQTAPAYCAANGLSVNRLRYWAYKRPRGEGAAQGGMPGFARVVTARSERAAPPDTSGILVELGEARVHVSRGFDRATLLELVEVLGGGGAA